MTKGIDFRGKTITFTSNGATPLFYKQFFRKDLLKIVTAGDEGLEIATENIPELAFIMAKQADKADMMNLRYEMYIDWLSLFEPFDLTLKAEEIFEVYAKDIMPTEEPKKKAGKAKG